MSRLTDTDFKNDEITFGIDELFFSRTDKAGLILAGNSVFQRVSFYSWEELLRKPHKIIRHPDMPRAVFWLLWDTIKHGKPIGAYVKNRAKDGRYYWVFAIVTPVEDGYLSVRLRPTSPLFAAVRDEYQALAAAEQRDKLTPAESAAALLARLAELGFSDYSGFMAAAIAQEMQARQKQRKLPADPAIDLFGNLLQSANGLLAQAAGIARAYENNAFVPLNFQVQAAQLNDSGATIGVISENYTVISGEIRDQMTRFIDSAQSVKKSINDGMFLVCTARLQQELVEFFKSETDGDALSRQREMNLLENQRRTYEQIAKSSLSEIAAQARSFQEDCAQMNRLAAGLEVIRIMGMVECARLTVNKDGLNELLTGLESFQKAIAEGLRRIDQENQGIRQGTGKLLAAGA